MTAPAGREARLIAALGLAQRAGKAVGGETAVREALAKGKGKLLLLAADAAPARVEEAKALAAEKNVPCLIGLAKETMGRAIGKGERAVLLICDDSFAKMAAAALEGGALQAEESSFEKQSSK